MRLYLFPSKPPLNFTRNETLCEHKRLLKVFGTMRLTGDLQKNFLFFFARFSVEKGGILQFPVGEEWFSRCVSLRVCFGPLKLIEF